MKTILIFFFLLLAFTFSNSKAQNIYLDINKSDDDSGTLDISTIRGDCIDAAKINGMNVITEKDGTTDIVFRSDILIKYISGINSYVCTFARIIIFVKPLAYITQAPSLIISSDKNHFQNNIIKSLRNYIAEIPDTYKETK